jgi:hypothetical protein
MHVMAADGVQHAWLLRPKVLLIEQPFIGSAWIY